MSKIIYLVKDNDDLVSHCRCKNAFITFPPQMDCPWCGCGWLFTCTDCRKAFTFARGVEVDETWEGIAARDLKCRSGRDAAADELREWVDAMKVILKGIRVGGRYVILDGWIIDVDAESVGIEGWHSVHQLPFVPQVKALKDQVVLRDILANERYWVERRVPGA